MAEDDEEDESAVTLGEGEPVEGAPLARVSERLMWGIEKSEIQAREGETVVRTADGPRELADVLAEVEGTYFPTRQAFEEGVRDVIGVGPVPTADTEAEDDDSEEGDGDSEETADAGEAEE